MHSTKSTTRKPLTRKLVLGFVGVITAATIGTAGIAAAAQNNEGTVPPTKQDCVNWEDYGFKNRGQCVSAWVHEHQHGGYGGDDNSINTDVDVDVRGNNNVVSVVIRFLFG